MTGAELTGNNGDRPDKKERAAWGREFVFPKMIFPIPLMASVPRTKFTIQGGLIVNEYRAFR